jgi:hypothetical protein
MVLSLVRKEGVAALAYSVTNVSLLWPCSLKILHADAQFVVSLERSISIHGFDDKHLFTLRYEGDNIMPGKNSLGHVDIPIPAASLDIIARQGSPQLRTLSLTLKAPCSVWCPYSLNNGLSIPHTSFHELLTLANATEVSIVFDAKWLGKDNLAMLQSAVEGSQQLTRVPVIPQFARLYQQVDLSILNSIQDAKSGAYLRIGDLTSEAVPSIEGVVAGAPSIKEAVHEAPPPYICESSKRSRDTRTSLTPDSPLPKRLLQDPTCVPSPTERAISVASLGSNSTPSSTDTVKVDFFQEIVASAVGKALPGLLREQLPDVLREQLPDVLRGLLSGTRTDPSPSPSLSPTPRSSQSADALTQHRPTPSHKSTPAEVVRTAINNAIKLHLQEIINDALDQTSEQFSQLNNSAGVELEDCIDDAKFNLATLKEDYIAAFNEDCNEKLVELQERLAEEKDEAEVAVKAHADAVVVKTWDRLDVMGMALCRHKYDDGAGDKQSILEQGRRAMSLPLESGGRETTGGNGLERH